LEYRRPDTAPLAYAMTQNNRAVLLRDLASLPGEDRRGRLLAALSAYDAALEHYRPDTAPLDYAATQNNRANLLSDLASLPGEDRRARLLEALRCAREAVVFYDRYQHTVYAPIAADTLRRVGEAAGEMFSELWAEIEAGQPPEWLTEALRQSRLLRAIGDFVNAPSLARLREVVEANPVLLADEVEPIFAQLLEQYAGDPGALAHLTQSRDILRACRAGGAAAVFDALEQADAQAAQLQSLPEALRELFVAYVQARRSADEQNSAEAWRAAAQLGEQLLDHPDAAQLPIALGNLRDDAAHCWNQLGVILSDEQKQPAEALAAFEAAARLQPDFAMWQRNVASTQIELGHLEAAEASLARAAQLEPGHPRLAELRRELDEARRKQNVA
jgi:tetratricopeptide (TPR) repeat protein